MKKWGLAVTLLYAVIVIGLLAPTLVLLAANKTPAVSDFGEFYGSWGTWLVAGVFVLGQAALLSLSVDTGKKRWRSRTPVVISAVMTGMFLMTITLVVLLASVLVVRGESGFPDLGKVRIAYIVGALWLVWGGLFYLLYRNSTDPVTRAVAWLFRGSVLELLIAVPSHVIVRRRHDCCAPMVTGFGITSGIAIMLISFGPSVLLLFKKRMERYSTKNPGSE